MSSPMKRILIPAILWLVLAGLARPALAMDPPPAPAIHQLRIYEIFERNKTAFHERFRDHAMRIMARHGFVILATWETEYNGRTEFAYLLRWPDEATMKNSWAGFLADKEWIEIKRHTSAQYGALVGDIHERVLRPTDYSPGKAP